GVLAVGDVDRPVAGHVGAVGLDAHAGLPDEGATGGVLLHPPVVGVADVHRPAGRVHGDPLGVVELVRAAAPAAPLEGELPGGGELLAPPVVSVGDEDVAGSVDPDGAGLGEPSGGGRDRRVRHRQQEPAVGGELLGPEVRHVPDPDVAVTVDGNVPAT